jgi:hypothetical protein
LREQHTNRASTGVVTKLRRRLQPGFYRCGPRLQGYLGRALRTPFLNPPAVLFNIDRRRALKKVFVNRASTGVTTMLRGLRSRLGRTLLGDAPSANRRYPERDANRASTGAATIAQGFSGLVHPDTVSQPAGGIPRVKQGDTQKSCTNRASTGVANNVRKCNQPGFYRCGQGAVLADCAREGTETKSNGYRYHSTREQGF